MNQRSGRVLRRELMEIAPASACPRSRSRPAAPRRRESKLRKREASRHVVAGGLERRYQRTCHGPVAGGDGVVRRLQGCIEGNSHPFPGGLGPSLYLARSSAWPDLGQPGGRGSASNGALQRPVGKHDRSWRRPFGHMRRQPRAGDQILRRVAGAEIDMDEDRLPGDARRAEGKRLANLAEDHVVAVGDAFRDAPRWRGRRRKSRDPA